MNYLLIITGVLLLIGFIIGWAKGLIGILSGILSWVIILVIMYAATPAIENAYMKGPVYKKMYNTVSAHVNSNLTKQENKTIDKLNEKLQSDNTTITGDAADSDGRKPTTDLKDSESMKEFLSGISISLPNRVTSFISKAIDDATNAAAGLVQNITADSQDALTDANATITDSISSPLARLMVRGIAMLTAFILALIVTRIIALLAHILGKAPVIGGFSRVLGGVFGIIVVLLIVWLFMDFVTCFAITPNGAKLMSQIEGSEFLNALYINNPLTFLISR